MEDRRTALAILLIIITVMLYSEMVLAPSMRRDTPHQATQTQTVAQSATQNTALPQHAASGVPVASGAQAPAAPAQAVIAPTPEEISAAASTTIETANFIAKISHLGARLTSFQLKNYLDHLGAPTLLDLVDSGTTGNLPLGVLSGTRNDIRTSYTLTALEPGLQATNGALVLQPDQNVSLVFTGALNDGTSITKRINFSYSSFLFDVQVSLESAAPDKTPVWLEWSRALSDSIAHSSIDPWNFTAFTDASRIQNTGLTGVTVDGFAQPLSVQWLGLSDRYFTATLIAPLAETSPTSATPEVAKPVSSARYGRFGSLYLHRLAGGAQEGRFTLFVGPKDYRVLSELGYELEKSIDLGFFSFLAYPLLLLIRAFYSLFANYGLAIVGLTLLIKGLFFPLTRASLRSMKAMQELHPEMQALRERIKDPTQLNQEMLQLYKRKGVNPLGGCLPILLQIPVFFGLYSALQHSIELRHAPFALWINDLSVPERLTFLGINFPVMIILMGVTMFYQQWTTPMPTVDPAQRRMMLWISAVFPITFLIFPFPSGLALYMLTNTCISLIQQAYLRNDTHANPGLATTVASLAIFAVAFVLTLL